MSDIVFGWYYIYLLKNILAVKKSAALFKIASVKKVGNQNGQPRNGCDGTHKLMEKNLITTIQVNFVLIPGEAGMKQHKFT